MNTGKKNLIFLKSDTFSSHKVGSVHFGLEKGQGKREIGQLRNNPDPVFEVRRM